MIIIKGGGRSLLEDVFRPGYFFFTSDTVLSFYLYIIQYVQWNLLCPRYFRSWNFFFSKKSSSPRPSNNLLLLHMHNQNCVRPSQKLHKMAYLRLEYPTHSHYTSQDHSQQAHDVRMTSDRCHDVASTLI